jgi:hypothetical protein
MITIADLSNLIHDQMVLLNRYEEAPEEFAPSWDEAPRQLSIEDHAWHIVPGHQRWECTGPDGRTVIMKAAQSSPFDFAAYSLTRYIATSRTDAQNVNETAVENWLLQAYRRGKVSPSPHDKGYWTFAG